MVENNAHPSLCDTTTSLVYYLCTYFYWLAWNIIESMTVMMMIIMMIMYAWLPSHLCYVLLLLQIRDDDDVMITKDYTLYLQKIPNSKYAFLFLRWIFFYFYYFHCIVLWRVVSLFFIPFFWNISWLEFIYFPEEKKRREQ